MTRRIGVTRKRIEVTERDIQRGKPAEEGCDVSYYCPIALAAKRAFKMHVGVGAEYMDIGVEDADLPRSARTFIHKFDRGEPVKPFVFHVDVPEE